MISLITAFLAFFVFASAYAADIGYDDTHFTKQWALKNTGQAILKSSGPLTRRRQNGVPGVDINFNDLSVFNIPAGRQVIVAVLDTGVDVNHPELTGRIWNNPDCVDGQDNSTKGCYGYNALDRNLDLTDDVGHGTHVAGIIAANANNNMGIAGITPGNVKIMPVKILSQNVEGFVYKNRYVTDAIADGIRFALQNGADVINLSLGWPQIIHTPKIRQAIEIALKMNVPIVVASGNNNKDVPVYPCSISGVICVGAATNTGKIAEFTNHGGKVDLLAPGDAIISTYPMASCPTVAAELQDKSCLNLPMESRILRIKGYERIKGSSQAAPFVTGIVAALKLAYPKITLNEIRSRLFNSATPRENSNTENKFSKYGLVDMDRVLKERPDIFISPDFKELLEVGVEPKTGRFNIALPIDNFADTVENIKVKLSINSKYIRLEDEEFLIRKLSKGKSKLLRIKGEITDLTIDNQATLAVNIQVGDKFSSTTSTSLFFSIDVQGDERLKSVAVDIDAKLTTIFHRDGKMTPLKKVADRMNLERSPEYYIEDPRKQNEEVSVITLIGIENDKGVVRDITIDKLNKLIAIFKIDINKDGSSDYFIYGVDQDKRHLNFVLLNSKLEPLFGKHSVWKFPVTKFEGLPIKNGEDDNFHWMNVKTEKFGEVLVPAVYKSWYLPDADNTDDVLDRIPNYPMNHLFYLKPEIEGDSVKVVLRAFDGHAFYKALRDDPGLGLDFSQNIVMDAPYFQDAKSRKNGIIRANISFGRESARRYYILTIKNQKDFELRPTRQHHSILVGNNVFPILDVDTGLQGQDNAFLALFNRAKSRIVDMNPSGVGVRRIFESRSWTDPLFNYIMGFNDAGSKSFLLESRYYVYSLDDQGQMSTLPIYRESSFPGVNFSETLEPVLINRKDLPTVGVFIDSSLIFGDRLYIMMMGNKGLVRPISLSLNIPPNCVFMRPVMKGDRADSHFSMVCRQADGKTTLRFMPMVID